MIKFTFIKRLRTNNRFNYTPRYFDGKEHAKDEDFSTKMEKYYETYNKNDFAGQWSQMRKDYRSRSNTELGPTFWIVFAALVFVFLWIIGFDLSIFSK